MIDGPSPAARAAKFTRFVSRGSLRSPAEFYRNIFGWKVRTRGDGELAFDDPGGVSGTWVKESDRTPDEQTRIYIMVDTIDETLPAIEAAGGRGSHTTEGNRSGNGCVRCVCRSCGQ